ncbi:MAG: ankyrin repeat domain-containing protein [Proteobacteria bacterium]|nr:ankyrin repeat domain-containing protein [Pseudomonadota bacterium]
MFNEIIKGRTYLVAEYLAQGNPANSADRKGVTLIRWCAFYGDVDAVNTLVEAGESLQALGENLDLNGAVFHAYPDLCTYLVEQGANVNYALPTTGETALHSALCKHSTPEFETIIEFLLQQGADPNAKTTPGIETGSFMRDVRTRGETPLHRAAAFASNRCIDMLLKAGALKDIADVNGDSPLSWASWYLRPRSILAKLCYGDYKV